MMAGGRSEAVEILHESERPLAYFSALIGIFALVAGVASAMLSYLGLPPTVSVVLGITASFAVFLAYLLRIAMRRSSEARTALESSKQELQSANRQLGEVTKNATEAEKGHVTSEDELRRQLTESLKLQKETEAQLNETRTLADGRFRREKASLEQQLAAEKEQRTLLESRVQEAYQAIQAERQSTDRAKFAPLIDPYFRTQPVLFSAGRLYFMGAWNRGRGAAENVEFSATFSSPTESWDLTTKPFFPVLEVGKRAEFQIRPEHFQRNPSQIAVTIKFDDMFGETKTKSVTYQF